MAISKCPKCDSTFFEIKEAEPRNSSFKIMFIQCSSCGAVVGVTDYYNTSTLLVKIAKKLGFDLFR